MAFWTASPTGYISCGQINERRRQEAGGAVKVSRAQRTDAGRRRGLPELALSFGRELQQERERRKMSLEAVAEGTRFSVRHLRALESGDYSQLPGGVFNKGIVRSYCKHLGLDEAEWLQKFTHLQAGTAESSPDWAEFAENVKRTRIRSTPAMRNKWWLVLLMLIAVVSLGWSAWHFLIEPRVTVRTR